MSPLVEIITAELDKTGVLPFARFMELALYCPEHGFYEKEKDNIGRRGDFYTSVSVGPLLGQMLAFQFAGWLEKFQVSGVKLQIIEAGAHDGRLAQDVLSWLQRMRPELLERIEYGIIEPSMRRKSWQRATLAEFSGRVRWFSALGELDGVAGVIFSNELLDAFPVHRLGWDAKRKSWFEWGVAMESGKFIWTRMSPPEISDYELRVPKLPDELMEVLPDGFTTEICPAAENWWRSAAGLLQRGKLLTLDYGLAAEEFFQPERFRGTLRTYRRHQVGEDVLTDAGEQDITAQVNFTALRTAGEAAGLQTEALVTQANFLTQLAGKIWSAPERFGGWSAVQTRQFQTLTHPEHLGRSFRALVQSKAG